MDPRGGVDVEPVRRGQPIQDVVAASGVELRRSGHRFVGCFPFHQDTTPALSVGGVPDRFPCFGCGASGDVIDWVQRSAGVGFLDAVQLLQDGRRLPVTPPAPSTARRTPPRAARRRDLPATGARGERAGLGALHQKRSGMGSPWRGCWDVRSIDVGALQRAAGGPVVGAVDPSRTATVAALRRRGVSDGELLAADLARRTGDAAWWTATGLGPWSWWAGTSVSRAHTIGALDRRSVASSAVRYCSTTDRMSGSSS